MADEQHPEDVGASTEKFQAFVREGAADPPRQGSNAFRIVTLLGGLAVLAVVIALLLR